MLQLIQSARVNGSISPRSHGRYRARRQHRRGNCKHCSARLCRPATRSSTKVIARASTRQHRRLQRVARSNDAYGSAYIARMISDRRAVFRACAGMLGCSMRQAARELGISYNHLILVLDAERVPSEKLATGISDLIQRAKPLLVAALRKY